MQELIEKLKNEAGLTEEQARQAIATIKNYVVEKFPMLEGAVNNVFGGDNWSLLINRTPPRRQQLPDELMNYLILPHFFPLGLLAAW